MNPRRLEAARLLWEEGHSPDWADVVPPGRIEEAAGRGELAEELALYLAERALEERYL